jgi:hypothetical protein
LWSLITEVRNINLRNKLRTSVAVITDIALFFFSVFGQPFNEDEIIEKNIKK